VVDAVMVELLPGKYEILRRDFDELRYGQFLPVPLLGLGSLSRFDPSRVPAGKSILHLWDYVPYQRPDGRSWDDTRQQYADRMIERLANFVSNVPEVILQRHVDSPVDMERTSPSFRRGDLHGIATTTYQSGAHRPTPALGQYTVPGLEGFYLVGPFQHPGGGVFGAGRATAMKVFEALKLDFAKLGRIQ
jgi:phytoene dehydrogenase-like protein